MKHRVVLLTDFLAQPF